MVSEDPECLLPSSGYEEESLSFMPLAGPQDTIWVSERAELQEGPHPSGAGAREGPEQFSV